MTTLESEIIQRIKKAMDTRLVTQAGLANRIGMRQYQISRLLSGKPFPSIDQLVKIANALDVDLYYLIGIQEASYRELSQDAADVADAYQSSNKTIKEVIKRVLDI